MSVAAVTWALYEVRDVSPADKLALVVLAEHAAPDGTGSWPSWKRIAEVAGVSRRTVARTIDGLEKRGLIRRGDQSRSVEALRAAGKDPRWTPVVWDLVMDGSHSARAQRGLPPVTDEDRDAHRAGVSPQVNRGANLTPQVVDQRSTGVQSAIAAVQQGCQSDTPGATAPGKACRPERSSGAIGDTQNQEKNQETTTTTEAGSLDGPNGAEELVRAAEELARAVLKALPDQLSPQLQTRVLRSRCAGLLTLGWTPSRLAEATRLHSWQSARAGAVVAWIDDLASQVPVQRHPRFPAREPSYRSDDPAADDVRRKAMSEISEILNNAAIKSGTPSRASSFGIRRPETDIR